MKILFDSEEELLTELKIIKPETLTDFFSDRVNEPVVCPICKSKKISIPFGFGDDEPNQATRSRFLLPVRRYPAFYSDGFHIKDYYFRAICSNCAYEINFSVAVIVEWLRENQGSAGNE
ncbi:hypothetical protein [Xenorhabdus bovienii]|uniref:hypothetical protein n=1 Tax=Xenorhabdus bovienii TaxID=40576 RepID=UPI0005704657|nr:hypothetical protein [Xenorhabdus bovienii]